MAQAQINPALGFLSGRHLTPAASVALRVVVLLVKWQERRRTRRGLTRLDAHLLKDVGLTGADVQTELARWAWQDR
ncbi:DUF1127 domain-containing protein [Nioella nitratireducens]|uniref:DUF1127 domain-containing protein n=1 Tax=Nioella nitratireducens TaxID=1287720 RepID=UPI0008FD44A2|nr:DUF1127 domain-containing protein [Nioella nitratireducens]